MALSPMMQQYHDAKAAAGDAILFFRMGDFYELFHEDATTAAKALGLTLTSRDKGDNPIPMAGFPHHQLEGYLAKLIAQGNRVAICDQVEDPKQAKGLVRREVTRVVTPGTLTDDGLLDPKSSNYLAAVSPVVKRGEQTGRQGLAWVELSTGRFEATTVDPARLADELARIAPSEILVSEDDITGAGQAAMVAAATRTTKRPPWCFAVDDTLATLNKHFKTQSMQGFGFEDADGPALQAAGAIVGYLKETQKASLEHLDRLSPYRTGTRLEIDQASRRSLEITRTFREGRREGSLLSVVDQTVTPMGARMFADHLANPLTDVVEINARLDAVAELLDAGNLTDDIRAGLSDIYDLERLLSRVTTGRASPRDLSFIGRTLTGLPKLKARLSERKSGLLKGLEAAIDLCPQLHQQLSAALKDDCPLTPRDGGFIREGFDPKLDELRGLATGGREWIAQYQARQIEESGIPSMKIGFNKVFGYYLEITNAHRDKVPEHFIRKQTLKNAERYITPELKEYEEKVVSADDQSKTLEYDLFCRLRDEAASFASRLRSTAAALAQIDVLTSLAELARRRNYIRPTVVTDPVLKIIEGRHPVLDATLPAGEFVPNDTIAGGESGDIQLITGPNMAGKSTYIRQVALLTLMAQMGGFVPAAAATIGVADRIFARVGAADELSRGQSTFMVEMTETARILNTATDRSLVILDEIGRGTSTYDGVSLAWAMVEYIHDAVGCRTFFATHYHELTDLAGSLTRVENLNVAVREWEDDVVFLHKIVPGAADKSYGIHVARLAGVPAEVNERAKQILTQLEAEHLDENNRAKIARAEPRHPPRDLQLTLFGFEQHPLIDKIRDLNANELTPLQALNLVHQWRKELQDEPQLKPR